MRYDHTGMRWAKKSSIAQCISGILEDAPSIGQFLFFMLFMGGPLFIGIGFASKKDAEVFFIIGVICLVLISLWILLYVETKWADFHKKCTDQQNEEEKQIRFAEYKGLTKYHEMDLQDQLDYQAGIKAMRELGAIIASSTVQKKEHDWAIHGGIASGIAGPFAGAAVAIDVMQKNAEIREKNEANKQWGLQQQSFYNDLASQAAKKFPTAKSMSQIEKEYIAEFRWPVSQLFSCLEFSNVCTEVDKVTGAVSIKVDWVQKDKSICIDGSLRAKLYVDGKCVGCGYMILPKVGTVLGKGTLEALCTDPHLQGKYDVKMEPIDLWEFGAASNHIVPQKDNYTVSSHEAEVKNYEDAYKKELIS